MFHKKNVLSIILAGILVCGMVGISIAKSDKAPKAKDEFPIENKYENPKKYEASPFIHKKHAEEYTDAEGQKIPCAGCHHVYKEGKNTWKEGDKVDKCVKCHTGIQNLSLAKAKKLPKEKMVKELSWAFHENCYGCHKAVKAVNKKANAPKSCAKCHKKIKKK